VVRCGLESVLWTNFIDVTTVDLFDFVVGNKLGRRHRGQGSQGGTSRELIVNPGCSIVTVIATKVS
jgi:hypothetical protein